MKGRPATYDVAIIGAGMAGMAAALFASERGLSCIQIGNGGGLLFASGLLDLMAIHPVAEKRLWLSPFAALSALATDEPDHPLARIGAPSIRAAFASFVTALHKAGLAYAPFPDERNRKVLTALGTIKTTYGVPRSMVAGADLLDSPTALPPCLVVDFRGLREFSAQQIASTLSACWPGLRARRIEFPGTTATAELYAAHLARALETEAVRATTIALIKPLLADARAVGLPAILGLERSGEVHAAFEAGLGLPVFEIPTMPTSVPGLRLQSALETVMATQGVQRRHQATVSALTFAGADGLATLELAGIPGGQQVTARAVMLATGRFMGRGLTADRAEVRESLLGLSVQQPATRAGWHQRDFLDRAGHAINRAGLRVDQAWRPLDAGGRPVSRRLFAAGSILAHQGWMRAKCGSGLALASAWAAVEAMEQTLRQSAPA